MQCRQWVGGDGFGAILRTHTMIAAGSWGITVTLYLTTKHNSLCQRFVGKHMGLSKVHRNPRNPGRSGLIRGQKRSCRDHFGAFGVGISCELQKPHVP